MIFLPPKVVQEQYLRPNGLPDELIDEIPSPRWVGPGFTNPMFPKPVVEQFVEERRPKSLDKKSYLEEEDRGVIDFNGTMEPFERIAGGIERLIEVLMPKTTELVGTEYIASKLGVSKQWVGKMAEKGTIPKNCIAPKVSGGRIWKFYRDQIDAWLAGHR